MVKDSEKRPISGDSDETLCILSRAGSREAGEVLAERYLPMLRCMVRPYFLAGADSEDLIQEGMLGLLAAMREYDPQRSSFKTFAALCMRRRIYSAIRRAQGKNHDLLNTAVPLEHIGPQLSPATPDLAAELTGEFPAWPDEAGRMPWPGGMTEDPEVLVIHRDEQRQMADELNALLSGFEKRVLSLYLEGHSYAEMAARLSRPVKSVDNAVTRIRRKLQHRNA